ncbi:MAG: shikimate kinase [Myxococcota bacterium]
MARTGHFDDIILVGHRGTGKTTLGRALSKNLDAELIDLDERIEAATGESCAEIIERSESEFRQRERDQLRAVLDEESTQRRIITPGAGLQHIPEGPLCIWLWRDGWEQTAREERARLRPDISWEDEVDWMRTSREPRWARAAHLRFDIPHGRLVEFQARILADHMLWAQRAHATEVTKRTWVVPSTSSQLERAARDARSLGAAGVEVRSDLIDDTIYLDEAVDVLASLRSDDPAWLADLDRALVFDVDLDHLDAVLEAGILDELSPRPLLLSSHPDDLDRAGLAAMLDEGLRVRSAHPEWSDFVALKYAPPVDSVAGLVESLEMVEWLRSEDFDFTYLPQGDRFAWLRPWLARHHNATNYVPVGITPHRCESVDVQTPPTPMDLQDWLPHLTGPAPDTFDGLLGEPVSQSIGDWWHRSAALSADEHTDYVKIPVGHDESDAEVQALLDALRAIGFRGLSVTSPMKRRVLAFSAPVDDIDAANTLRRSADAWEATDTDEAGMRASLTAVEHAGYAPGTIAVIGQGGVSPAVSRAIETSDWELVHHASSREGWTDDAPDSVTVVVNAAGNWDTVRQGPPDCEVWIDLNYTDVSPAPDGVELHLNGDVFFEAQARAQREFWRGADAE